MGLEEVAPVPSPLLFPLLLPLPPGKNRLKQKLNNVQQSPLQWLMHPGLDFQIPSPYFTEYRSAVIDRYVTSTSCHKIGIFNVVYMYSARS